MMTPKFAGRIALFVILSAAMTSACAPDGAAEAPDFDNIDNVVNVYSWSDYIAPETIPKFEAETGIKVNYDTYDSSYIVDTKLLAGGTGYDVIAHAGQNAARLIPLGLFARLDTSKIEHWQDLDRDVLSMAAAYEGTAEHSAIYMWGSTGFAYNVDMIAARVSGVNLESAAMMFDPQIVAKLADCGVTFLDEADDVFPLVLAYLGLDPNSTDDADILAVENHLKKLRPYIRYFSSTKMINDLPSREVCLAMSWSGDYAQAAARAEEAGRSIRLAYSVPLEGSRLWFDGLYIPSDARHMDNAYRFIDFVMRPENIAAISNHTYYANGIVTSKPMLLPELLNDPGIYPDDAVRDRLFIYNVRTLKQERVLNRAFARIKSGL